MNKELTRKDFEEAGYKRFDPPPYEREECITDMFQKCFRDKDGNKLYFITVERWDYTPVARGKNIPISYNFVVQFETTEGRTVNVDMFSDFDIEAAEDLTKKIWNTGWFKAYEEIC